MTKIERAAAALVEKMAGMELHEWYADYYRMLTNAVAHPQENVTDSELGDVTFFAVSLVWEVSEIGDAVYELPEYQELLELLEEAGLVRDAQRMSEREYGEHIQEIFEPCPAEHNDELVWTIKQRVRPN